MPTVSFVNPLHWYRYTGLLVSISVFYILLQILIESLPSESSSTELQLISVGQLEEDGKVANEELDK